MRPFNFVLAIEVLLRPRLNTYQFLFTFSQEAGKCYQYLAQNFHLLHTKCTGCNPRSLRKPASAATVFHHTNTGRFVFYLEECSKCDNCNLPFHTELYTLHHKNLGRATNSTNRKQRKGEKQILIGLRGLGSDKWDFRPASVNAHLQKQSTQKKRFRLV